MDAPLVSVVTPVYNGAEYIAECIESVLAQTWTQWRYTIVDNCSDDGSGEIAAGYAERDPRIRVVSNEEFLGQVDNLNRAMSLIDADSRYTKMVLADDWIFPRCLEQMVATAEAHPTVGVVGAYRLDDRRVNLDGLPWPSFCTSGREIARRTLMEQLFVAGSPNSLLYRSDLVRERDPFFPTGTWHEDTEVFFELLERHDFGFVHEVLTFTRRENESLTSKLKLYDPEHRLDKLIATMKYGPRFLDADEFQACRHRDESDWYRFLAGRCLYRTDASFWEHQHRGLARAGLEFHRWRFARAWLGALWRHLLDPEGLMARFAARRARTTTPGRGPDTEDE